MSDPNSSNQCPSGHRRAHNRETELPPFPRRLLHPRHWATWLGVGLLWLAAQLPHSLLIRLGRFVGSLVYHIARSRRHVADVNLRLCFPELSPAERKARVKATVQENIIGFFESAFGWWGHPEKLADRIEVKGLEHIQRLQEQGRGALMIGGHYSNLDLGGILASFVIDFDVTYRRHDNPVFDWLILRGRAPYFGKILDRNQLKEMVRRVRGGRILWYAADQDYGRKHSIFAPFFGVQAASVKGTPRLAQMCHSPVVIIGHHRLPDNRYLIEFTPPLESFPSGDEADDARRINQELEKQIRKFPDQYMWVHRRFKTRPPGEEGLY